MTTKCSDQEQTTSSKRRRHFLTVSSVLILWLVVFFLFPGSVSAQNYQFSIPSLLMEVYIQPDGSAHIIYDITFENSPAGEPIRVIDIGTPDENYDISNMDASIDGSPLGDIRVSEYIDTGVEIHLGDRPVSAGESATLHFEFTMPDMVYQDTSDPDYASFRIRPTGFDPSLLSGTTDIWIVVHTLPGIDQSELLYQTIPFSNKINFEDHAVASWRWEQGNADQEYLVGLSFPKRGMTSVIKQSTLDLAVEWLEDNQDARVILGAITVILAAVAFLRFTGGTGYVLLVIVGGVMVFLLATNPASQFILLPLAIAAVAIVEFFLSRRKMRYFPAVVQVEGGGIKRGLTAPEAGVILELPLNKILMLIIFGLLEKGIVRQTDDDPLSVEVTPEYKSLDLADDERNAHRLKVAQNLGIVVRQYEHKFIERLEKKPGKAVHEIDFSSPMKALIEHTASRMKGFDLSDTQDYYKSIIKKALDKAKRIGDIPERERFLDKNLQWILMDDAYPTVFAAPRYHYRPVWIRPFHSSDRIGGSSVPRAPISGRTSFTDVAASFTGWTQKTMGRLADSIAPKALQIKTVGGAINLSGVDRVTGDVFKALAESSSSGGGGSGGGGGCACACAGCACACACAGGGR